jgi:hypothetical protein
METIVITCSRCGEKNGKSYTFRGKTSREEFIQRKLEEDWVCINENIFCIQCATEMMITSCSS